MAATETIQETGVFVQTRLQKQIIFTAVKFGLPEVDKLLEDQQIKDPPSNPTAVATPLSLDKEDRISRLPGDILEYIISLLTTREGAATSILSTRWRNLWATSVSRLNLDDLNLFGYRYPPEGMKQLLQESERSKFLTRLDHIYHHLTTSTSLCPSKIDALHISFPLENIHKSHIDRWIDFAVTRRVTNLKLNFFSQLGLSHIYGNPYWFPFQTFGLSLTYLYLNNFVFEFLPDFQNLRSLVTLNLSTGLINCGAVQNILSNCPFLEWLSLKKCIFLETTTLEFVDPSIRLKHLHISGSSINVEKIKVHDVNILSFEFMMDFDIDLSIKNLPHLAWFILHSDGPVKIEGSLPRLETFIFDHEESELPKLSAFNNIKRLVYVPYNDKSNLLEVVWFLEACPLLQQLELDMCIEKGGINDQSSKISTAPGCLHHNLKEVRMHAFDSHPELIEFAKYLLKNAVVLEKMIIYPTYQTYLGNGMSYFCKESTKLVGMPLEEVREMLQKEAQSSTEILIM